MYIYSKSSFVGRRTLRSVLSLRFFTVVFCLFVVTCLGISLCYNNINDDDFPLFVIQILLCTLVGHVIALLSESRYVRCHGAQANLLVSRAPPDLIHS